MRENVTLEADILENCVEGFHRYRLEAPMRPDYVSGNLCRMLGCEQAQLLSGDEDAYARCVHPDDRAGYLSFLHALAAQAQRLTAQYRLLLRDGKTLYVQDTMISRRDADGVMRGYSTLADVTPIKRENEKLHLLNETVPCGIVKYTCTESPQVTYINEEMLRMLRLKGKTPDQLARCRENVCLCIPPEERVRFREFLDVVYTQDKPIAGEINAMRGDGTRVRLYGFISKCVGEDGEEEFQSVCVDVTERYERKRRQEEQRYFSALSQVYDDICELDFSQKSVRFFKGRYFEKLGTMANMPLVLEDALRNWAENAVIDEDRPAVRAAFETLVSSCVNGTESAPVQMEFRVRRSDQSLEYYIGVFLRMNGARYLMCCRNISRQKEAEALRAENSALRSMNDQMCEIVMQRFTDGMVAFEIRGDKVRPMYISENVCGFFGYAHSEWLRSMEAFTPICEFVSHCHIPYEAFAELLENREAEFDYTDLDTQSVHRIKAICTARTEDAQPRCYVMLYDMTGGAVSRDAAVMERKAPDVYIRTFGYFDVFVDGNPIAFRNEKAKELFALLADRRGGFVTSGEAIAALWEDEPASAVTLARYRKVALRLRNTLDEYGIGECVESVDGKRRIVTQRVRCDLYDYLSGEPQYAQLFKGSYLQNYSWGEVTLCELSG